MDSISLVTRLTNHSESTGVFQAPDPCVPRELPVSATSIVIPAHTLRSNQTYQAALTFGRVGYYSTNTVAEMAGQAWVTRRTDFTLRTGPGTVAGIPARFVGYRLLPNGNPELTFTGTPLHPYTLQRATSLSARDWTRVGSATTDATGRATFEDAPPGKKPPLFYRAVTNLGGNRPRHTGANHGRRSTPHGRLFTPGKSVFKHSGTVPIPGVQARGRSGKQPAEREGYWVVR